MKRILSLLLCILLLASAFPAPVLATEAETVSIGTVAELKAFAENCILDSWSKGKSVILTADLDLAGAGFTPIPLFMGSFYGNGHTISGFLLTADASVTGLFRQVLAGGVVEDLNVSGIVTPGGNAETVGGVAGENHGIIRNCTFTGDVAGRRSVGGIAGANGPEGTIENCTVGGGVTGEHRVGGVAGENQGTIRACVNRAEVNMDAPDDTTAEASGLLLSAQMVDVSASEEIIDVTDVGGVAGESSGILQSCGNEGTVGYPNVGYNIGGVAGRLSGVAEDCRNSGAVYGRKDVGGVVGQLDPDANWSFPNSKLNQLRRLLDGLQERIDQAIGDAGAENDRLSADITGVLDALDRLDDAAEAATDAASAWANENIETVNELSRRVSDALDGLVPVFEELTDFTEQLPDTAKRFGKAFRALGDASDDAASGVSALADALDDMDAAMDAGQGAMSNLGNAAGQLAYFVSNPENPTGAGTALTTIGTELGNLGNALLALNNSEDILGALLKSIGDDNGVGGALTKLGGGISDLAGAMDWTAFNNSLDYIQYALSALGTALGNMENANSDLRVSLGAFSDAGGDLSHGMELFNEAADLLSDALSALHRAVDDAERMVEDLAERETLQFTEIDEDGPAKEELFDSLRGVDSAIRVLADHLDDTTITDDMQSISDQLFELSDFLVGLADDAQNWEANRDYAEDVSANGSARGRATVAGCVNRGDVSAETNAGGIVGAVTLEISFDREDELNLSSLISGSAKYLIYAMMQGCENSSAVSAKKESAGGIVGRMDYGAAFDCVSSGVVSCSGDYAGGIAGYSLGTLRRCHARSNLSAGDYVGGVAGFGHNLYDCLAMPNIDGSTEFQGSIAGDADGTLSGNYYAESGVGGFNGFSFDGQAQRVSYDALVALSGGVELFRTITVRFLVDGEAIAALVVPFGGSIEQLPSVPDKDGKVWKWDDFDNTAIYHSLTVEGDYYGPLTSLSYGGEVPAILVEGVFYDGQSLTVLPLDAAGLAETDGEEILAAYKISVEHYDENLTVRLREDADGKLYSLEDGMRLPVEYQRDGSYIVFSVKNGASIIFAKAEENHSIWIIIGIAAGIGVVIASVLIWMKKKKRTSKKSPTIH